MQYTYKEYDSRNEASEPHGRIVQYVAYFYKGALGFVASPERLVHRHHTTSLAILITQQINRGTINVMGINEKKLTKGQIRKLNALRKSLGTKIADRAFAQWQKEQPAKVVTAKSDPVAEKLVAAMASLSKDKAFNLGRKGYVVKRAKGKGARGFVAEKMG